MSGFIVEKASVFTLIQDIGRYKYTHLGVSNSGALDEYAMNWAFKLLGDTNKSNILEMAFSNVVLKVNANTTIAITGAYCDFYINDELKNTWQSFNIKAGDVLKIGKFHSGSRVYLAVKNGFKIKPELGSCATSVKEGLGGLSGEKLKNGDILEFDTSPFLVCKRVRKDLQAKYSSSLDLRVTLSYQEDSFGKEAKEKFFGTPFKVTADFNRMACKLSGEIIESSLNGIISEGISFGAIQVPKDGQPIILLKERQTIGGYPKIGSVLGIDCFKLAQAKIGTTINFKEISIQEAQEKSKEFYSTFS